MAIIYIDNQPYEVNEDTNLLQAGLSLGFNIPYFCWHPALGSVGACRLCAIKQYRDENDAQGRIVMSCMTPVTEGARISIEDPEVKMFRKTVLEWLMVNHPHDCPICDEGGECHLQDMTVMTGQTYREFRFKKRTYRNQYLGPLINHEMNRCIQCYRCVRFYRDYAGGDDLQSFGAHDHVYFGRAQDGILENEFSGNLVEVCPTGVFTDKSLKSHYTRKWDMQTASSVCTHCGVGCNTIPGERYGSVRRIRARYNGEVNRYFLCDRGRYGYEFCNDEKRITHPIKRGGNGFETIDNNEALTEWQRLRTEAKGVIGIGSPRASLEDNFTLQQTLGANQFSVGVTQAQWNLFTEARRLLEEGPARTPSLHEMQSADAVLVLGEDLTQTAPMMALSVRQAVRNQPAVKADQANIPQWHDAAVREVVQEDWGPLFIATPQQTKLDDIARETCRLAPDDVARLGYAIAHALDSDSPAVDQVPDEWQPIVDRIAQTLQEAKKPLVVAGPSLGSAAVMQAAANIAWALCKKGQEAGLSLSNPECNSMGLSFMDGMPLESVQKKLESGEADTLVILENDLYRRADQKLAAALLQKAKQIVVLDALQHETAQAADLLIPAASFAEGDGTFVNNEGRAQRYYQVYQPENEIREGWRWLALMAEDCPWQQLDDVVAALAESNAKLAAVQEVAPKADFRIAGERIPRQTHRYSGRTAMRANESVHEPKPPQDPDSPYSFSMEGYEGIQPSPLMNHVWSPGWNSIQSINKFQSEVGGPLHGGDPGKRLIEPQDGPVNMNDSVPKAPGKLKKGQGILTPIHHIFGSEELSSYSPQIRELFPAPYIALRASEAKRLHVKDGQSAQIDLGGEKISATVSINDALPEGVVGIPVGILTPNTFIEPAVVSVQSA